MSVLGQWTFSVDRDATASAYAKAPAGGVETCNCAYCRNFRVARERILPFAFLELLNELGIDFRKDGEIYEVTRTAFGLHLYHGWYHFIGRLETTGDFPRVEFGTDFSAYLAFADAPRLPVFEEAQVVQLEFECGSVPWLLEDADLDLIS